MSKLDHSEMVAVLEFLRPGALWTLLDDPPTIVWDDQSPQPSLAECEAAWKEIERIYLLRPVRAERDRLLAASDWTQIADVPVDAKAWAAYRQALRDLPATIDDPTQPIDWPEAPK